MAKTSIEWAQMVWNPIVGCTKVSSGCSKCYAEKMAKRLKAMGRPEYQNAVDDKGHWTGRIKLLPERLDIPLRWKKPRRVFVNSMSDLFHEDVTDFFIAHVFSVMAMAPLHKFMVLTKRPERMIKFLETSGRDIQIEEMVEEYFGDHSWCAPEVEWPLPNGWLGVSVEDQKTADERLPILVQVPAAKRFISCEPLLGPIDLAEWISPCACGCDGHGSIDWVIVGGESGPGAREMKPEWVESIVTQCEVVGIPVFVKQLGGYPDKRNRMEEWPEELRVRKWPE